ncbi:MAG: TadE family protein [Dehalococcoidia bacterium]
MGRVIANAFRRKRSRHSERGQTLVEMGFLLPIFLVLIIGVVEVTNAMNAYVTVISTARDGARLGSKGLATDDEIKNLVVIETERLRNPINPLTDIAVTHNQIDGVNAVKVEVCNDYEPLLDVPLIVPDTLRICSATAMRAFPPSTN